MFTNESMPRGFCFIDEKNKKYSVVWWNKIMMVVTHWEVRCIESLPSNKHEYLIIKLRGFLEHSIAFVDIIDI